MKAKTYALLFITAILFANCKKHEENKEFNSETFPSSIAFYNLSGDEDIKILSTFVVDSPIIKKNERSKRYTFKDSLYKFFIMEGQVDHDSTILNFFPSANYEFNAFRLKGSGSQVQCYDCMYPPIGKSFIRYIRKDFLTRYKITNSNGVALIKAWKTTPMSYNLKTDTSDCFEFDEGIYKVTVFHDFDSSFGNPIIQETSIFIEANKVYFLFVDDNNKIRLIER